ncbi:MULTISPECIES: ATP-binding protein [Rhizobium]|uniref:ATP-binding protein n=1 Tax=Rhizobium TaxID=379 RepID=UPI0010313638|nr:MULTISPECIES: ATP-binding protein [Rhizobium]TAZ29786.1 ATP-binding protein [Rhizobium leguminosarum]TBC57114.1 ATP-binding protein [Rhizobium ruizarguesonis]
MAESIPSYPFERSRYLGSVARVTPLAVRVNFPFATEVAPSQYAGHRVTRGQVGEFVVIESFGSAIIGRITEIQLPDRDRLSVEPERTDGDEVPNPIGNIRLLGSVDLNSYRSSRGIGEAPRVGDYVYLAHPDFIRHAIISTQGSGRGLVDLGHLSGAPETRLALPPISIFGRHCAVLGSTGGGKSWSTARLVEEVAARKGKVILLDPTGEYHTLRDGVRHVHLGGARDGEDDTREFVSFPYFHLSEMDLFAFLQPSPGIQAPKLRDAIQSLKLINIEPGLLEEGSSILLKEGRPKKAINKAIVVHDRELHAASAYFDILYLVEQVFAECVQPIGEKNHWGNRHQFSFDSCVTLCMRITTYQKSPHLAPIFAPPNYMTDLTKVIEEFLADDDVGVLRVSMRYLAFEHNTRELVVNAVGRYLLSQARAARFQKIPLVVAIDEAHQFLSKSVGDDNNRIFLDAFGVIAKEGRKYGLTCLLATQRPRDIPEDVLSQIGMFVVHRLINERDQGVVINASGILDGSTASFFPNLRDGEALIVGADAIMPLPIMMDPPACPPKLEDNVEATWMRL